MKVFAAVVLLILPSVFTIQTLWVLTAERNHQFLLDVNPWHIAYAVLKGVKSNADEYKLTSVLDNKNNLSETLLQVYDELFPDEELLSTNVNSINDFCNTLNAVL